MINGKYGVLAPESCRGCKKKGTACMVYHPGLRDMGRAIGTYCGECTDRSVKCDIGPHPFAEFLVSNGNATNSGENQQAGPFEDEHVEAYRDKQANAYEVDQADAYEDQEADDAAEINAFSNSGALPTQYKPENHQSPQTQNLRSAEIPDSEEQQIKIEDKAKDRIEASPSPSSQPSQHQTIKLEDLNGVVEAAGDALQMA